MKKSLIIALLEVTIADPMCAENVSGATIANSNRIGDNLCVTPANEGEECEYECEDGYVKIGRHVC